MSTKRTRNKQQEFQGAGFTKPADSFGGSLLKGNPKGKRPLESEMPILLTLRGKKSAMRTPMTLGKVNRLVYNIAAKHGVKIYEYANVGNHLHVLIKIRRVHGWPAFIRELTGQIAQQIKEFLKTPEGESYWLYRPHTRIIRGWKRAYRIARTYIELNQLEAEGFISRAETKTLKDLREIWSSG